MHCVPIRSNHILIFFFVGYTDYSSAFYVSDVMSLLNIVLTFLLVFDVEPAKEDLLSNIGKILRFVEADVFLLMMFILGGIWGFVESYLFIYLKELDAPNYLLGTYSNNDFKLQTDNKVIHRLLRHHMLYNCFFFFFLILSILGMTLTIGSVVGIPFLYGAESIVNRAGRANVIILAFFIYFARCFGYSYITFVPFTQFQSAS